MLTNMKNIARLLGLTALAMLVQGYHPGLEDDAYYLAAIKNNLNPALFPHDADFFRVLFQATAFDKLIALSIRWTHIPLYWGLFLWQCAATFLMLWGCWRIARRCFDQEYAQWAAVAMVAALLTLPVAGSGLSLTDQHLHPRALATALILAAIVAVIDGRRVLAGVLLLLAFPLHLNMTPFGVSYCVFLAWNPKRSQNIALPRRWPRCSFRWAGCSSPRRTHGGRRRPLGIFIFCRGGIGTNGWESWARWRCCGGFARWRSAPLHRRGGGWVAERIVYFGVFQLAVALILMLPPPLERFRSLEPMRFLHLVYLLFVLLSGGLLARYFLKRHVLRWLLLFVPLCAGMFYAQRQLYPGTVHLELPGRPSGNDWVEAFHWISHNTPVEQRVRARSAIHGNAGRGLPRVSRPGRAQRVGRRFERPVHRGAGAEPGAALAPRNQRAERVARFSEAGLPASQIAVRSGLGRAYKSAGCRDDLPVQQPERLSLPRRVKGQDRFFAAAQA